MPISTHNTFLMHKESSGETWKKLVDIKSFPNLGGERETLETTTMSDKAQTFIPGIQSSEVLSFNANYDMATYQALKALEGKDESYSVWFGATENNGTVTPDGSNGKFDFKGDLSVYVKGADVNNVVEMGVNIVPSTPVDFSAT